MHSLSKLNTAIYTLSSLYLFVSRCYKDRYWCMPTDLTYDALMKTGIIYAVDEGMYDLADQFIPEQLVKKTDLMAAIARSLI